MSKEKVSYKKTFLAGIITENPVFVSLLGMCPTLATTKSVEAAFGMGLLVILTLLGSNLLISLLRKIIPSEVKIPCYIIIIATFVTIIKMLTQAFIPALYDSLGVFISLIVVNCIILGRAESFASKNKVSDSIIDALGYSAGFAMAIIVVAFFRELIGTGALSWAGHSLQIIPSKYAIKLFSTNSGAFITLGLVVAGYTAIMEAVKAKKAAKEKLAGNK